MTTRFFLMVFSAAVFFTSCRKDSYHKYSGEGDYVCEVKIHTFGLYDGFWDSTYFDTVSVEYYSNTVRLFDKEIEEHVIQGGQTYKVGEHSHYYEVRLHKDSLYYRSYSGGHGGNGSITYNGVKVK